MNGFWRRALPVPLVAVRHSPAARLRAWLYTVPESTMLFPAFSLCFLALLWMATLHFISIERSNAEQAISVLSRELVTTYEAQVLRALRDIDQTLNLVKYAYELSGQHTVLQELKAKAMLPSELLFVIRIADQDGKIVADTRSARPSNISDDPQFSATRATGRLSISQPQYDPITGEASLLFSRRLINANGNFAGIVTLSVATDHFVSGYEESKFGQQGLLGIVGDDGRFRVRRSGDLLSDGEAVDPAFLMAGAADAHSAVLASADSDGVARQVSARKLVDFPLVVIAGLSDHEQLANFVRTRSDYLRGATAGTVLLILVTLLLWSMSWQLRSSRRHDIAERKRTEQSLRIAATAFDSQEAMLITDANRMILQANRAFASNTGHQADHLVGKSLDRLMSNHHDADFYLAMWRSVNHSGIWQGEIWQTHADGNAFQKWLTISAVRDDDGVLVNYVGSQYDITERKQAENKIHELAFFDPLTGLPNRTLLQDLLRQLIATSAAGNQHAALLLIDLDYFKAINDTLGHDMGDALLVQVAQRIVACIGAGNSVSRLGGDEFVVLLAGLGSDGPAAMARVKSISQQILSALDHPYLLNDVAYRSTASIGVTLLNDRRFSSEVLMKQADLAMYKSKAGGRNAVRFFDPAMEAAATTRATLERDLHAAIEQQQFVLHYQAQIADGDQLSGAEVLVRWQHPQRGMVSPMEFIPVAEDTGLILPIGTWVMETACRQLACWATVPSMEALTIAVNVSARQFQQSDFVAQVIAVLDRTGARPQRLKLELTESLLAANLDQIIEKMQALKETGIHFSLDDFGTGFSSLSYLKLLPLDQLKIDQSFVRNILTDPNDAAIVRTVIALANTLGLGIIAEGVETDAQRSYLADAGCHAYQGYLFSRPLPVAEFEVFAGQRPSASPVRMLTEDAG
ncbi:EAL domain-containing protein [Actimicrobium sp. CCC2.4]|uniref:bifunctional diguanylate cyclase/phosphodiesterase n=1 Tax=Actimicrobium sp. CCC2.4 TaxID=3048606 RepID=UPI002AC9713A|nr:EAL domain-containing protein [Actimicrobium sp. CCC2.4]MEB0135269.1 EAL domain-containing protein [Actimicrobium sp. CCC2.4]WPX31061.1 EAL domain-containing protein [Actimicrobium sp. CCC2.4]